jgi:hypothetical protein
MTTSSADGKPGDIDELLALVRGLRRSDMSVLLASLDTPDSQIATVARSPNYVFWSKLESLGFAVAMPLEIELPPERQHILPRSFALTELGRRALPELLKRATDVSA